MSDNIVINLGKVDRADIKKLKKGYGKLHDEIQQRIQIEVDNAKKADPALKDVVPVVNLCKRQDVPAHEANLKKLRKKFRLK